MDFYRDAPALDHHLHAASGRAPPPAPALQEERRRRALVRERGGPRGLPGEPAPLVLVRPPGRRLPVRGEALLDPVASACSTSSGWTGSASLLILLTTLLGFIAILSSWTAIHERVRQYYVFLLLLQTGMLGIFCALDMFLFYVFWEVMLVPMYFLIGIWGGARRLYAAIKFFLYTLVGSVVMLLGILALYFQSHEAARASRRPAPST